MRFTIGRKFASLLAAFLALQVLQLSIGIYQVWHVSEEAELLSGAAKVRPLFLAEASRAMAEGNYDRRLAVASRDEIGALAGAFNRMAGAVEARTLQLSALNHVAIAITSSSSLQDILNEIMRSGIHLTGARAACIAFYDQGVGRFKEWVTQGLSEHFVQNMAFRPGGLADETFTTTTVGTYILSNDRPETQHKLSKLTHDE